MIHLPAYFPDISALAIRIIVAISFLTSSSNKAKNLNKFAKNNGLSVPMAGFVMVAEFAGALGMISGIFGQLAALGLMLLMLGTISLHIFKWKSKYWASSGGWEYDLMLLLLSSVIFLNGPGKYVVSHTHQFFTL